MSSQPQVSQRDLRMRSKEIMDAVEGGQAFTVTPDGREIGELVPLRGRRRFVSRAEFAAMSRHAPAIDLAAFLSDQERAFDEDVSTCSVHDRTGCRRAWTAGHDHPYRASDDKARVAA